MPQLSGVCKATKKDGTEYFRSSITYQNKHISLGSFPNMEEASKAYWEAKDILSDRSIQIHHFSDIKYLLSHEKFVCLINFRDNHIYIKTPIFLRQNYFSYYLTPSIELKFDIDDLFYYSVHKIIQRKGHLFVSDYGMQVNILSRYGIKNYAIAGRDYLFLNNDNTDFRYSNIQNINLYYGVSKINKQNKSSYKVKIHIKGDYIVGIYDTETEAAIAYNKAVDQLKKVGIDKNYQTNFICNLNGREYAEIYSRISISKKVLNFKP